MFLWEVGEEGDAILHVTRYKRRHPAKIFPRVRKRNLEFGYLEKTTTQTIIAGVAPVKMNFESSTMSIETEHGCKCGSNCSCDPCKC
ncbi:Metallothionein, family 15, plant [Corchorus olitorius]|uniref:Metallothionein-like protein n=1 Tax=Corchorus olitorius TaxID=93759 RepID=A0A1R3J6H7_9ROSI|nr:Metallothionein, family 15, plant [Corchorus olitorius]